MPLVFVLLSGMISQRIQDEMRYIHIYINISIYLSTNPNDTY